MKEIIKIIVTDGIHVQIERIIAVVEILCDDETAGVVTGRYGVDGGRIAARDILILDLRNPIPHQPIADQSAFVRTQDAFVDQRFDGRAGKSRTQAGDLFQGTFKPTARTSGIQFQNGQAGSIRRHADADLFIDPPGTDERIGQAVIIVAGGDENEVSAAIHAVDEREKLRKHRLGAVGHVLLCPIGQDLVDFIEKDHGGLLALCRLRKRLSDLPHDHGIFLDVAEIDLNDLQTAFVRQYFGKQRLAVARATVKNDALGQCRAPLCVRLSLADDAAKQPHLFLFLFIPRNAVKIIAHKKSPPKNFILSL